MNTIDRNTEMSTIDQAGANTTFASPFFIASVGITIALVALAAVVAVLS
ncbi:MAG: hypothetical protein KF761_04290 [Salinibacterium sp.]|nr:hypothetical protein [Salinibacterium sp.]